jgi:hypothetical protein
MPSRSSVHRLLGTATAVLLLLGLLSACSPACSSGAPDAEGAVAGLISASRNADDPADLCAFVAPEYTVSDDQLADLQARFADHPNDALSFQLTGQMGSTAQVIVSDGEFSERFDVTSNADSRWTVAFGTLFGEE